MPRPVNILLICTDQHRYDVISTHPGSVAITPNLQRLADQGTVFDQCYASNPVCAPTRASMLTGQLPTRHGLWANGVTLPRPQDLVSRQLSDAGYRCGLIGKLHLSAAFQGHTERQLDDGFEVREWAHDPFHGSPENAYHRWLQDNHPDLWEQAKADLVTPDDEDFKHRDTGFDAMPTRAHYSTWVAERASNFLATVDDRPFFLVANFYDPHHPFVAPEEFRDLYPAGSVPPPVGGADELSEKPDWQREASRNSYAGHGPSYGDYTADGIDELRRKYYAMVSLVDQSIGAILDELERQGVADETMIIFTSDHGEMLGDHGMLLKGAMMYDCAVRVPLIIRQPGVVPANARVSGMVGSHDIAGTIRQVAGLPPHPLDQGIDLVKVAAGELSGRDWATCQYRDSGYPTDPPIYTTMLRTPDHKLIVRHGLDSDPYPAELYDLGTDPDELHNVYSAPQYADTLRNLYARLIDIDFQNEDRTACREFPW